MLSAKESVRPEIWERRYTWGLSRTIADHRPDQGAAMAVGSLSDRWYTTRNPRRYGFQPELFTLGNEYISRITACKARLHYG
jgi:hypothetical protein